MRSNIQLNKLQNGAFIEINPTLILQQQQKLNENTKIIIKYFVYANIGEEEEEEQQQNLEFRPKNISLIWPKF